MNKILEYRIKHNLKQCDLAYKLNLAGIKCNESYVSRWERGLRIPSQEARKALARVLGISEYELFKDILVNLNLKLYKGYR